MCGNFNGDVGDDFKTSGDEYTISAKEFGDSWKTDQQCTDKVGVGLFRIYLILKHII
jgi:hypothetical protein